MEEPYTRLLKATDANEAATEWDSICRRGMRCRFFFFFFFKCTEPRRAARLSDGVGLHLQALAIYRRRSVLLAYVGKLQ